MNLLQYLPEKRLTSQDDVDFAWVQVMPIDTDGENVTCEKFDSIIINKDKGIYQIENVPYKLTHISKSDIIYAELDETSNELVYKYTIKASGNISVKARIINPIIDIEEIRTKIRSIGCYFEQINALEFLLNLEPQFERDNEIIIIYLDELVDSGVISYKLIV